VTRDFDIGVVGSGFAGSLLAIICRRLGRKVVLIEKGRHPRFAIGESSSPLANLLAEDLADRYDLPRIRPLAKWGTWQRTYPEIGCGLKRGFSFYGHSEGKRFIADPDRRDQLLVAASPRDEVADTHWYREDFDHFLVREAEREGVEYLDQTSLTALEHGEGSVMVEGERRGAPIRLRARFLVDASGPRGFLHRALGLAETAFAGLPATQGLFTHFEDVLRLGEMGVLSGSEAPPYPVDDAALHHVFRDGWIWVLRFANGRVSAGVAAEKPLADAVGLAEGEAAWKRLLSRYPTIQDQFASARPVRPFIFSSRLSFRSSCAAGRGWALLPSAAAFVDPLLSTGFPLTLLGIERLARALERFWGRPDWEGALAAYSEVTLREADTAALLVAALYASFSDFELFAALSLLYFAAASFAEAARRLSRPNLAESFLCGDHAVFAQSLRECCRDALALEARGGGHANGDERERLLSRVFDAIEPLDIAGLGDRSRRRWHPMEAEPLLAGAHKLGATPSEIEAMLARSGFFAPGPDSGIRQDERTATLIR
jgi:tetracycline 7-halogenase / FADH2 O2-dependent halogenase